MQAWAIVTGGAHRLGKEFCLTFARAGWNVLCHYHRSEEQAQAVCETLQAMGVQARTVQADLSQPQAWEALWHSACNTAGELPLALVNSASLFEPDTAQDFTQDLNRVEQQWRTNALAPMALASAMARSWAAQEARLQEAPHSPVAIHVLDQKVFNLNPDYFSYTVSKLALERAVALQAQALAPHLRVMGIAPGLMFPSGPQTEANYAQASRVNLMRRPLQASDVARTAVFLAENPALTGMTLCVDNGQHLVPLERDIMFMVPG